MERILSGDEKIRRAEEIYYRRKMGLSNSLEKKEEGVKTYIFSKIFLQILIILNLSIIIIAVQNKEYIFTESFLKSISEYNINLVESVKSLVVDESYPQNTEEIVENVVKTTETLNEVVPNETAISEINQMNIDIQQINESYSFLKPVEGTVTSIFGNRESEHKNVSSYHTGIDIATEKGTSIIAAISRKSGISFK